MNSLNITKQQFERQLKLEGRHITVIGQEGTDFKILVRPIASKTSQESITIVYSQEYNIGKGTIFELNGEHFLIVNRRSWDSEYFYTSTAIRCNTRWRVNGKDYYLVCGDLSSPNPSNGSKISEVNGNISMYTSLSYMTYMDNNYFYVCGGTYKCVNKFDIDGLTYYYFQRDANFPSNSYVNVEIHNISSVTLDAGQTAQINTELQGASSGANTRFYYAPMEMPVYTSSNESVATINQDGLITAIGEGSCIITSTITVILANTNNRNPFYTKVYTRTISVTVNGSPTPPPPPTPTGYATITHPGSVWYKGAAKTFTGHVFDDYDVEQPAENGTWTLTWDQADDISSYLTTESGVDINQYKATLSSSAPTEAVITVRWDAESGNTATKTITVAIL